LKKDLTEKWRAEKYVSFLLHDYEHFLMKASSNISALHFSVIVFEWFCRQSFCLLEKLAALGFQPARRQGGLRCVFIRNGRLREALLLHLKNQNSAAWNRAG